ncbi:MAG TPA: 1-deoxy-D-xylulose-5-phosphate reductoisomerase [Acidimicrobiales bacterium]|nr:1-deoxy-D-xylulose-5-phosphate reductoisomerase [Acidimicrobiales bacterium]
MAPKTVYLAGSTGSIGRQALDVVRSSGGRFSVVALSARSSVELLAEQAREVHPAYVAVGDPSRASELAQLLPPGVNLLAGPRALADLAETAEIVLNGVVGFAGLEVTLAALGAGKRLALANKESLIAGGPIVQRARRQPGAEIVPVDSEHCAVHQCLRAVSALPDDGRAEIGAPALRRLLITASGGPFRGRSAQELGQVSVDDALAHPTWKMGPKITVDSSTLMNKGLEVIEAHLLFGASYDQIDVVIHPQSVVHSMVETTDGAVIAQLSMPDMRLPIGYALSYPERMPVPFGVIDWATLSRLDFDVPDTDAFPCLALAYDAGRRGGTATACLNGANEVAVEGFLNGRLRWADIPSVIRSAMSAFVETQPRDLCDVLAADAEGRALAAAALERLEPPVAGQAGRVDVG